MTAELNDSACIYTGADFTTPQARGIGVNTQLTQQALEIVVSDTLQHMQSQRKNKIALLFGLTRSNAGNEKDLLAGRSCGLARLFATVLEKVAIQHSFKKPCQFSMSRHEAFKPSFPDESDTCTPLPDADSVPGYGCAIVCTLQQAIQE